MIKQIKISRSSFQLAEFALRIMGKNVCVRDWERERMKNVCLNLFIEA